MIITAQTKNFFLFGLTAEEVFAIKENGYHPREYYESNTELKQVVDSLVSGPFSEGDPELFKPIVSFLLEHDEYLLLVEFQSYIECCERAAQAYTNDDHWTTISILNTSRCGVFSSDRSMRQYCEDIWGVKPLTLPEANS